MAVGIFTRRVKYTIDNNKEEDSAWSLSSAGDKPLDSCDTNPSSQFFKFKFSMEHFKP